MIDQALIDELSAARYLPDLAVARSVLSPSAVAPPILAVLDAAADGQSLSESEGNLLFWGVHILAAARDRSGYPSLMRMLRRPREALDDLLGDAVTATLSRVLAGMFDGDAAPMRDIVLDPERDPYLRHSVLGAMTFLAWEGRIPVADLRALLERFDDERRAAAGEFIWDGWVSAIALLGLRDLAPRAEAAWRDDRIPDALADRKWLYAQLTAAEARPQDIRRFEKENLGYFSDLVADLGMFVEPAPRPVSAASQDWPAPLYEPMTPVINPMRHVGRNDPCPCGSGKKAKKCCLAA